MEGTTVSRIAAAVGVTPGALYRHFESRAALLAEANRQASVRAGDWLHTAHDPDVVLPIGSARGQPSRLGDGQFEHYRKAILSRGGRRR